MFVKLLSQSQKLAADRWLIIAGMLLSIAAANKEMIGVDASPTLVGILFTTGLVVVCIGLILLVFRLKTDTRLANQRVSMLEALNSRQYALLEHHPYGVYESDADGALVYVNTKYVRMTGRAPSELRGSGWALTVSPDDRGRVLSDWHYATGSGRAVESKYSLVHTSGEQWPVSNHAAPMTVKGEVVGYIGTVKVLK
jgi:PAS domain S-box-containing protein